MSSFPLPPSFVACRVRAASLLVTCADGERVALELVLGVSVPTEHRTYLSAGIATLSVVTIAAAYVIMAVLEERPQEKTQ